MVSKSSKLLGYVNYRCVRLAASRGPLGESHLLFVRMRITVLDGRQLVGRFLAFDRHMNLVLGDAEEFRRLPPKKGVPEADREVRRPLGLVLIRGESVISLTVEGPPPTDDRRGKRDVAPVRSCSSVVAPVSTPP
jgi:small nuclear ribonucleoprotein (snRNP)-like protein